MESSMSWCRDVFLCGSLSILIVWKGMEQMCGRGEMRACGGGGGEWEERVNDTVVGGSNKWGDVETVSWRDVKDGGLGGIG